MTNDPIEEIRNLKAQIIKLNECARNLCKNHKGESKHECIQHWDCSDCIMWENKNDRPGN